MLTRDAVSLNGKVAIVTGGGGGCGKATSQAFAAFGAKVVVAEIDAQRCNETVAEIKKQGGDALALVTDVREEAEAKRMVEETIKQYGRIDILVNNVGEMVGGKNGFVASTKDDWEAQHAINFGHVLYCTHAALPHMIRQGEGGSIINATTIEAFRGYPDGPVYSAYKGAVVSFTQSIALELGQHNIRVNAISPETTRSLQVQIDQWMTPETKQLEKNWIPLGRFGDPDDYAGVAVFLASDLSRWVSGAVIDLSGGARAAGGWFRRPNGKWTQRPVLS